MNEKDILEARQRIADHFLVYPTVETKNDLPSPTRKNPKEYGGGVLFCKGVRLESEEMILYIIIIVFSITLSFGLGYIIGKTQEKQKALEARIVSLETQTIEQKNTVQATSGTPLTVIQKKEERRIPQSSVLRNKSPQQIRKEQEHISTETIEKEMIKLAREFGGSGTMKIL